MPLGHTMAQTGQTKYTYRKNNTRIKKQYTCRKPNTLIENTIRISKAQFRCGFRVVLAVLDNEVNFHDFLSQRINITAGISCLIFCML